MIGLFRKIKKLSPLDGYNKWSETYHLEDNPIKKLSDEYIQGELPELQGRSVLDAGCGSGKFCQVAITRGASLVRGLDLSPKMIAEAEKNCPEAVFAVGDLSTYAIKDKYDVVICGLVLGHIDSLEPAIARLAGALNPGGHLIITDFHPDQTMKKAKRTFSHHGKTFEVKHTLHLLTDYSELLNKRRVKVISLKEPEFNSHPVIFGIHGVGS